VGNGRLGAMVFGGTEDERLQFNEDTLWVGRVHDYSHPDAADYLTQIRRLVFQGRQQDAERLAMEKFMSVPLRQMPYQPFGDFVLHFPGHDNVSNYRRELNLDSATVTVSYDVNGVTYRREVFAGYPDQVIVVRLSSSKPGALTFRASIDGPHDEKEVLTKGRGELILRGRANDYRDPDTKQTIRSEITFEAHARIKNSGGSKKTEDNSIVVSGADSALLILAAATNYRNFRDVSADPAKRCRQALRAVRKKSFEQLHEAHVKDHRSLFRRVRLDLGRTEAMNRATDERIRTFGDSDDPQLVSLFFQFGRYLLIAASRPGSQPANLQGIWNDSLRPPWESKWTTNINVEMNYWPVELCNLSVTRRFSI